MDEQFLTLMADLDDGTQARMSGWYDNLRKAGFTGTQTPGLPFHISMATFPLDKEREAIEVCKKAAAEFQPFPVHVSHIGLFAGGKVLFGAPERSERMADLHAACEKYPGRFPWTPHITIMIDEPETICTALSVLIKSFYPFTGSVTRLHLCAFWPTREILSIEL